MYHNRVTCLNATHISQFWIALDAAIVIITTSVSVAWIMTFDKPFWIAWEAWYKSLVSLPNEYNHWHCQCSSWRSNNGVDTACSPSVDTRVFPSGGWNSCTAEASSRNRPSLLASTHRKFFQLSRRNVLLDAWITKEYCQHHDSCMPVSSGCPSCRCPTPHPIGLDYIMQHTYTLRQEYKLCIFLKCLYCVLGFLGIKAMYKCS